MSKVTNDVLTRSGTGCFTVLYPYGNGGHQMVKIRISNCGLAADCHFVAPNTVGWYCMERLLMLLVMTMELSAAWKCTLRHRIPMDVITVAPSSTSSSSAILMRPSLSASILHRPAYTCRRDQLMATSATVLMIIHDRRSWGVSDMVDWLQRGDRSTHYSLVWL